MSLIFPHRDVPGCITLGLKFASVGKSSSQELTDCDLGHGSVQTHEETLNHNLSHKYKQSAAVQERGSNQPGNMFMYEDVNTFRMSRVDGPVNPEPHR